MEIDPNYEYEAPKWFDFTTNVEGEINDNSSLDDSWFERVHPLHEPRDPGVHDTTSKPLLTGNQGSITATSCSKPQTKKPLKRNYNSKKSLGIKTIHTKRGQHENPNNREGSGTGSKNGTLHAQNAVRQTSFKEAKKDSRGNSKDEGQLTPDENQCSFTPPWTNSPITKQEGSTHRKKLEGSSGSLGEAADFSLRRVPLSHSPLSPVRIRSLKSSTSSAGLSPCSPKTSLLSKAITGNVRQVGRKRRLLPSVPVLKKIPDECDKMTLSSPSHCSNQLDNHGYKKPAETSSSSKCSDHLTNGANQEMPSFAQKNSNMEDKPLFKEEVFGGNSEVLCTKESCVKRETVNQCQYYSDEFYKQEKDMVSERSLDTIHETSVKSYQALVLSESEKERSLHTEKEILITNMSLEELLRQHNKKIIAARNQYDENGRKIRTAEPSFCPAPSKKVPSSLTSSSLSTTAACKRPATSMQKPTVSAKQKRRSCMAAVSNTQSESTRSNAPPVLSKVHTNVTKKGKDTSNQQTAKQKRRSCVASLQNSSQTNTADQELRDLIAQHNSRVSAKRQ